MHHSLDVSQLTGSSYLLGALEYTLSIPSIHAEHDLQLLGLQSPPQLNQAWSTVCVNQIAQIYYWSTCMHNDVEQTPKYARRALNIL